MSEDAAPAGFDVAALTHAGADRDHDEDSCSALVESAGCAVAAVADGVSGSEGGEVASQMAIEVLLRAFRGAPASLAAGHRLYRAVQQANIEIYDRSIAVPELRGMATTLTAVAVEGGELTAVHVGDSRLYLLRDGVLTQLTKDHTVAAERARLGLMTRERARTHADRCVLTRSVGRELIVSRDRIAQRLAREDALVLCTDGLYNVLGDPDIAHLVADRPAADACRALVEAARERRAEDDVSAAVVRVTGSVPGPREPAGVTGALRRLLGRPR